MKTLDEDLDDNGNLKASRATPKKKDSSSSSAVIHRINSQRPRASLSSPLRTFPSPRSNSMLAVAPFTSSTSSSFPFPSTTVRSPIDAPHTLLPEEIEPACNLPRQESSPHPVKPLNSTASQSDKKEGRSVLEKLKSTIHPGRTA
ncbi:hypothetical protein CRUP_031526, partial [Coryphaenoides rupestris]